MPIKSNKTILRNKHQLDLPMPSPSKEEIDSLQFNAIWNVIKSWDINVPEFYSGYCGGNGSHQCMQKIKLFMERLTKFPQGSSNKYKYKFRDQASHNNDILFIRIIINK